jgi:hypothetical protein
MPNAIPQEQNNSHHLGLLAATSWFYRVAERFALVQFTLSVVCAITLSIMVANWPSIKVWTTVATVCIALLDSIVLESVQSHYRKLGAKTQELFDTGLLGVAWNSITVGARPDTEDVDRARTRYYRRNPQMEGKRDWYSVKVAPVDLYVATLICQRTNLWWDRQLRRHYVTGLWVMLVATILTIGCVAIANHRTADDFIIALYAPIAPAVLWFAREIRKHIRAGQSLNGLVSSVDGIWKELISKRMTEEDCKHVSRKLQDNIYQGRFQNPIVFDWINALLRPRNQQGMNAKAEELVKEAKANGF